MTPANYGKCEAGTKTQTRRILTPQPNGEPRPLLEWSRRLAAACHDHHPDQTKLANHAERLKWKIFPFTSKAGGFVSPRCPFGTVGDRLYVKESIYIDHFDYFKGPLPKTKPDLDDGMLVYRRDGTCCQQFSECECGGNGAPWRSPLFMPKWAARLWLEIVEVRVERLNDISEVDARAEGVISDESYPTYKDAFRWSWCNIQKSEDAWIENPWVWVLLFRTVRP
jgi:hypothetical protein